MRTEKYCKQMFTVAALWNWVVTILFIALAALRLEPLTWFLNVVPTSFLWFYLFFGLVGAFGFGYYWAGQDVRRNRDIIKMGILGKTWVVVLVSAAWWTGDLTALAAAAGAVDLLFTILFIDVLMRTEQ
jgi:hypothetical protein